MSKRGNGEGSIYVRKDGRWTTAISLPDGKRRHFYGKTRSEVDEKLLTARTLLSRGLSIPSERLTLGDWLSRCLETQRQLRPRTYAKYESSIRLHLVPGLGRVRVARLSPDDVERYLHAKLDEGLAPKTVHDQHTLLRAALRGAKRHGVVNRNVAGLVDPVRVRSKQVAPIGPEQARAILGAIEGDQFEALYQVALCLGLRQGEILGLRWSDIDFENATLTVTRSLQRYGRQYHLDDVKTEASKRKLAIPEPLAQRLRRHRTAQLEQQLLAGSLWQGEQWPDLVFTTELGAPLAGSKVTRRLQALLKAAGLPHLRFHDLRHATATVLLALGVDLKTIQTMLGHSQIHVTMNTYAAVIPELNRDAADRVGVALWGAS